MPTDSPDAAAAAAIFACAFGFCAAIIAFLLRTRLAWRIATDHANERSLHAGVIPRVGGWGLVPAAVIAALLFAPRDFVLPTLALGLFAVSYIDDRGGLPPGVRFLAHGAAAAAWFWHADLGMSPLVALTAGIGIVWITNLFNFMDGADGLAGGMAVFAFSAYAIVAMQAGAVPLATWSIALAGAALAFLLFNFNPARVFLGDAGSITLGFLAGAFGIEGWGRGVWPFWFPFLVAAPFFLDASVTLLRRMARRERPWEAHREHYYQRLIRSGWTHRRTALAEYAVMAASAVLAIAMLDWPGHLQHAGLIMAAAAYAALAYCIDRRWKRHRQAAAG